MDKSFVVAIISLLGTLITVIVANATQAWSKWLDVKQKENDHKMGLRTIYLTSKLKAAENAVGKWTIILNYYNYIEKYLRAINPALPLAEEFSMPMEAQLAKLNEAMINAVSEGTAFLMYFDIDESLWNNDVSDLLFARFSRISLLTKEAKLLSDYINQSSTSSEQKKEAVREQDSRLQEMIAILDEFPVIVNVVKERLLKFMKNIRQQLKEYEQL